MHPHHAVACNTHWGRVSRCPLECPPSFSPCPWFLWCEGHAGLRGSGRREWEEGAGGSSNCVLSHSGVVGCMGITQLPTRKYICIYILYTQYFTIYTILYTQYFTIYTILYILYFALLVLTSATRFHFSHTEIRTHSTRSLVVQVRSLYLCSYCMLLLLGCFCTLAQATVMNQLLAHGCALGFVNSPT